MNQQQSYLKNKNYWIFSGYFFLYFFIMGAYFPFFPVWLKMNGLDQAQTGFVFSCVSFFALCFQPLFGLLSNKLGLKKHLLWVITILLVFFGPFFIFVLGPLLKVNITLGALVDGFYLGLVFNGGYPAVEAYVEKVSRRSGFEFGKARMFGCFGWAICASIVGIMITKDVNAIYWVGSGLAILLIILVKLANPEKSSQTGLKEDFYVFDASHGAKPV